MHALIIVPTYNERDNVAAFIEAVTVAAPDAHVLVVDDASPDGTGDIAAAAAAADPRVHLLRRAGKQGLGPAYVAGFSWGMTRHYDAFVQMDADFSHHPRYLPVMLQTLADADVAVGSRYVPGGGTRNWGWHRRFLSRGGNCYARRILGVPVADLTGGFNGWRRPVLDGIGLQFVGADGYAFQIELKYRAWLQGYRPVEFPIVFEDRRVGCSKMSRRIVLEALLRVWWLRWHRHRFADGVH